MPHCIRSEHVTVRRAAADCRRVYKKRAKTEDLNYAFFTLNGEDLGPRYWTIRTSGKALTLAPAIAAYGASATFSANFGQRAFTFKAMEAKRLDAVARGEGYAGDASVDAPAAGASLEGAGAAAGIIERCAVLLTVEPAPPTIPRTFVPRAVEAAAAAHVASPAAAPSPSTLMSPSSSGVLAGLGLGHSTMPSRPPPLSRGATTMGLTRPAEPPKLRRAVSSGDGLGEAERDLSGHAALVNKPSRELSFAASVAEGVAVGKLDGLTGKVRRVRAHSC